MNFFEYISSLDENSLVMGICIGSGTTALITVLYVLIADAFEKRSKQKRERRNAYEAGQTANQAEKYGRHSRLFERTAVFPTRINNPPSTAPISVKHSPGIR